MRRVVDIILLSLLANLTIASDAHAYLDPGTSSMVASAIIGLFAAIVFSVRKYYYYIKNFFSRKRLPVSEANQDH